VKLIAFGRLRGKSEEDDCEYLGKQGVIPLVMKTTPPRKSFIKSSPLFPTFRKGKLITRCGSGKRNGRDMVKYSLAKALTTIAPQILQFRTKKVVHDGAQTTSEIGSVGPKIPPRFSCRTTLFLLHHA
jgi:hypothetical protein